MSCARRSTTYHFSWLQVLTYLLLALHFRADHAQVGGGWELFDHCYGSSMNDTVWCVPACLVDTSYIYVCTFILLASPWWFAPQYRERGHFVPLFPFVVVAVAVATAAIVWLRRHPRCQRELPHHPRRCIIDARRRLYHERHSYYRTSSDRSCCPDARCSHQCAIGFPLWRRGHR